MADLIDVPSPSRPPKKQRTIPVRRSRAVRTTYYGDGDGDDDHDNNEDEDSHILSAAPEEERWEGEKSDDDEFDPFKKRAGEAESRGEKEAYPS